MLAFQLIGSFILIFAIAYIFGTLFPIMRRNLFIPLTMIYIFFFFMAGRNMHAPPQKNEQLNLFVAQIEKILGFNMADITWWFILFFLWVLIAGVFSYIFDLFMRDRAKEIFSTLEKSLSLYGVRNILLIACFLIPIILFLGMSYRFITTRMMFLGLLTFTSAQLEVLFSSAKHASAKMDDKNVFFVNGFSLLNAMLLFIFMMAMIAKRT